MGLTAKTIHKTAPVVVVVAAAVGLLLAAAVGLQDIAVFAAYQLGFVAVPGWLLYRVLAPEDALARTLVFGWALGYALEVAAYIAASAVEARGLFPYYPLLAAPLLVIAIRRGAVPERLRGDRRTAWATAGVGVVSLLYLGATFFAKTPLPWRVEKVTYLTDLPYHVALAAEALHHWPVTDPNVSGTDLYYHVWAHFDLAATSDVTGLPLSLVFFRLAVFPLTLIFIAELVIAARAFIGRASVGALAAGLLLLVGEADIQPWDSYPFAGFFFLDVWLSPTFLLGLVFFLPAITLIMERLSSDESIRAGWKRWLLLAIFLVGSGGAKATILPVILGALVLTLGIRWLGTRRLGANALMTLGSVSAAFLFYYVAIYRHSNQGLAFHPLGTIRAMPEITSVRKALGGGLGWPVAVVLGSLGLFGPQLAGLGALLALRRGRLGERRAFLLALFVAGLGPFYLFHQSGNSQVFFTHYGLVAAALLAAEGIVLVCASWTGLAVLRSVAAIAVGVAASIVLIVYAIDRTGWISFAHERALMVLLVLGTVFLLLWRWSSPSGRRTPSLAAAFTGATGLLLLLWHLDGTPGLLHSGYLLIATLAVIAGTEAVFSRGPRRREVALLVVVAAATVGALDLPLDHGPDVINRIDNDRPFYDAGETGLNRGLYEGLTWIRKNTSEDAVLAVNNYDERSGLGSIPDYFYYSAFAERRVFLEGWFFTATFIKLAGEEALHNRTVPFPERLRLNTAVFEQADSKALRVLVRDYGVRYLVDDKLQGKASPSLGRLGRIVYMNPAVTVYAVGSASRNSS